jgi:glycosyltransferase involved in cell wall biosynthesis
MPGILKEVPEARLMIIGTGPLEEELKRDIKKLGLDGCVEFTGYVEEYKDMLAYLAECSLAVAPYVDDENTFTRYADPAKPKDYVGVGLPVVITKVPQVAWEIDKSGAGIAIDDDADQLVSSVVSILKKDDTEYRALRENAQNFARDYSWDNIFTKALRGLNISV